jgi:hypothetical protein
MIAGCVRLSVSSLDITGQGDPILPFELQLGVSYVPLVAAIAVARSKSAARWVLGFVIEQIVVTFITCYLLPRRIPDDLTWIPYVAVAQFLTAGFLLAGVLWCRRFRYVQHAA